MNSPALYCTVTNLIAALAVFFWPHLLPGSLNAWNQVHDPSRTGPFWEKWGQGSSDIPRGEGIQPSIGAVSAHLSDAAVVLCINTEEGRPLRRDDG
jgi:hypothetical protein